MVESALLDSESVADADNAVQALEAEFANATATLEQAGRALHAVLASAVLASAMSGASQELRSLRDVLERRDRIAGDLWGVYVAALCERAQATFTHPSGVAFSIQPDEVVRELGLPCAYGSVDLSAPNKPSLGEVWAYLERTYAGAEAEQRLEGKKVSIFVSNWFGVGRNLETPVWKKDCLELEIGYLSTEETWGGGMRRYCYSSDTRIREYLRSFADVARLLGAPALADDLEELSYSRSFGSPVVSRERFHLEGGAHLTTFNNKIVVRLPAELSADLMALVNEWVAGHDVK